MKAELICIGDELLIGQTINTNAAWLGEQLNMAGWRVNRTVCIADNRQDIINALNESAARATLVIITGGLGPTRDDITKSTLCTYFDSKLVVNQEALDRITGFFEKRGLPMLEANLSQAELPELCTVIQNTRGTACGMWFEKNKVVFISMPGVPYEMQGMTTDEVLPALSRHFNTPAIVHRTILTQGVGESFLAEKIADWEDSLLNEGVGLAYLPSPGAVKLRLSAYSGGTQSELKAKVARKEAELLKMIGEHVYGFEKQSLQTVLGDLLMQNSATLSCAESCTGGYLSHLITSIPGSSRYFQGGVICYDTSVKINTLGVPEDLILKHTVVSEEVAKSMAENVREKLNATYGLATTGIAGPDGATDQYPVGSIWIGLSGPNGTFARLFKFGNSRERNIQVAANSALNLLRKEILG
jgi:nicotinamide-nucleotide amidase